jgi:Leucine-rich repeat (LRR) protein
MTTFHIETYLNSLSSNVTRIIINNKNITSLPDLTRFKKLKLLDCSHNQLTSLTNLPEKLQILD